MIESFEPEPEPELATADDGSATAASAPQTAHVSPVEEEIDVTPDSMVVTDDEVNFLKLLAPLVSTPRATKRLVNTYQLVRASIGDVPAFLAAGQYKSLLLLLALISGSPGLSAAMVRYLRVTSARDVTAFVKRLTEEPHQEDAADWDRVISRLAGVPLGDVGMDDLRSWLPVVSRFSFRPGLGEAARGNQA